MLSQSAQADRTGQTREPLGIALLGCGTVGAGVAQLLLQQADSIVARGARPYFVTGIAVRSAQKPRPASIPHSLFTTSAVALIDDPRARIVVECIGGLDAASGLVERALVHGKHVVTANKDLLATRGPELRALAAEHGVTIAYEAAVGGAIPIVRTLLESLAPETILEVGGVLNGTTNFILDEMARGASYDEALAEAMRAGFAEADPSSDVSGLDAAHKLAILCQLAFRTSVTTRDIARRGIESLTRDDVSLARRLGFVLKLIAVAREDEATVTPAYVPREHAFAQPSGVHNCVRVIGRSAGTLTFAGAGAGREPTASAVVADVVATLRAAEPNAGPAPGDALREHRGLRPLSLRTVVRLVSFRDARPARDALAAAGIAADLFEGVPALATTSGAVPASVVSGTLEASGIVPESTIPLWDDLPEPIESTTSILTGSAISQPAFQRIT